VGNPPRWKVDVTGNGPPRDLLYFHQQPGKVVPGGVSVGSWLLKVQLPNGHVLSADTKAVDFQPTLARAGNVDGRPGDELFVRSRQTSATFVSLFTYDRGKLIADKPVFAVGTPDLGEYDGITCSSQRGRHFITAHSFHNPEQAGHPSWTRQDTVYVWSHAQLKRYAKRKAKTIKGQPPASQTGIACGHAPTRAG
jgi:hypothetical protein